MARMTEEEAFALDEKWTKTDPKIGPNGSGFLAKRRAAYTTSRLIETACRVSASISTMTPCNAVLPSSGGTATSIRYST